MSQENTDNVFKIYDVYAGCLVICASISGIAFGLYNLKYFEYNRGSQSWHKIAAFFTCLTLILYILQSLLRATVGLNSCFKTHSFCEVKMFIIYFLFHLSKSSLYCLLVAVTSGIQGYQI